MYLNVKCTGAQLQTRQLDLGINDGEEFDGGAMSVHLEALMMENEENAWRNRHKDGQRATEERDNIDMRTPKDTCDLFAEILYPRSMDRQRINEGEFA